MSDLTALFALYPRFYVIKSAYGNSEYRFLKWSGGGSSPTFIKQRMADLPRCQQAADAPSVTDFAKVAA
ncbi:hypothetical protein [Kingella sp. (in: b-proteobacteria)]|uniref:hypothetical protein n=1 Tax=Kingella sp. (in: b-proteobacteria) TaxID=2020713 RepID=UPI0026DC7CDC|nr:hypothetical protein [Kingella sp. (in: b-proteobacteria)]MDO4656595.1 hypothetical protein [Kingella sp. (in: b-proteobacteria)]